MLITIYNKANVMKVKMEGSSNKREKNIKTALDRL